jgi:hydrogenase nickel incorporation protein HypA/HybF
MHEFAICRALLLQVSGIVSDRAAESVDRITVEVGPLSGIEPDQLRRAFSVLRTGGLCADAELAVESGGVRVTCLSCGATTETRPNRLICGSCGGFRTRLARGDELRLLRVEIRVAEPVSAPHPR